MHSHSTCIHIIHAHQGKVALQAALRDGFVETAASMLVPGGEYNELTLSICGHLHANHLQNAKSVAVRCKTEVQKLMVAAAESDPECYDFGASVGKTEHTWMSELSREPKQNIEQPTAACLYKCAVKVQPYFEQAVQLLGLPRDQIKIGPVKTEARIDAKIRKDVDELNQSFAEIAPKILDTNRFTILIERKEDFAFLDHLRDSKHLKVCRIKLGTTGKDEKWPKYSNELASPPCLFMNLELMLPSGQGLPSSWIVELQVLMSVFSILKSKDQHKLYEVERATEVPESCPYCKGPTAMTTDDTKVAQESGALELKHPFSTLHNSNITTYMQSVKLDQLVADFVPQRTEQNNLLDEEVNSSTGVSLILGSSGSGKSTDARVRFVRLWRQYSLGEISTPPLFIPLPQLTSFSNIVEGATHTQTHTHTHTQDRKSVV